jgi:HNH endonuclease
MDDSASGGSVVRTCSVEGCGRKHYGRGFCGKHYQKWREFGDPKHGKEYGAGYLDKDGYLMLPQRGRRAVHIDVVERVLGKKLPENAVVHHIDGNRLNNANSNLLVCHDRAYHNILHRRERALNEYGNANARKCTICLKYDMPENFPPNRNRHKACHAEYETRRNHERSHNNQA